VILNLTFTRVQNDVVICVCVYTGVWFKTVGRNRSVFSKIMQRVCVPDVRWRYGDNCTSHDENIFTWNRHTGEYFKINMSAQFFFSTFSRLSWQIYKSTFVYPKKRHIPVCGVDIVSKRNSKSGLRSNRLSNMHVMDTLKRKSRRDLTHTSPCPILVERFQLVLTLLTMCTEANEDERSILPDLWHTVQTYIKV